jgi:hypothetical protein
MKPDLRISVKDYLRNKNLKIQLTRVPFAPSRQFWVRMNGQPWPKSGAPVSLTELFRLEMPHFCSATPYFCLAMAHFRLATEHSCLAMAHSCLAMARFCLAMGHFF